MTWIQAQVLAIAAFSGTSALAIDDGVDLSTVDRTMLREPPSSSGEPQYCLFVVSAEKRVWFVLDGDDLYMDINGNGDLTDPGEKLPRLNLSPEERRKTRNSSHWRIPDIKGNKGEPIINNIQIDVNTNPGADFGSKFVYFDLPDRGRVQTRLTFARTPAEAPILHPTGPHRLSLKVRLPHPASFPGAVSNHFHVDGHMYVGGLGRGTSFVLETVNLDCRIEIPLSDGSTKIKEFRLNNYITGPYQTATVILPQAADEDGTVKITLSRRVEASGPAVDSIVVEKPLAELRVVRREKQVSEAN